jgi:NodT family efflux transporter outer membrane factor (OMF) lipoprotein
MSMRRNRAAIERILRPLILPAVLTLAGCTVGPNYVPPEPNAPAAWHSEVRDSLAAKPVDPNTLATWWTTLGDPNLSRLIERAIANNLDLKVAQTRVLQARANLGISRAGLLPSLSSSASNTWTDSSGYRKTGHSESYSGNFDSSWELDLFGGTRRSIEAREADLQASWEDRNDTLVSLVSDVALSYVDVRTYQTRLAATETSLAAQEQTYQLTSWRAQSGLSDELAVYQAKYNLDSTRSQVPSLRSGLDAAMNRLAILIGEPPGKLHKELTAPGRLPVGPKDIAVGVPADALRQRPDVRKAERNLAAQTAKIGEATADLYPKFSLTGSIRVAAPALMVNKSTTTSGGPQATWAIFDGGVIRQNIELQSVLQQQYLFQYEAAILTALEEAENAMVSYTNEQQRRQFLQDATQAARTAADLAQYEYQAGLTDFSNVLDAQRSLLSFQDQLAQSEGTVTSDLVRLYKALGGGWTSQAEPEIQTARQL